MPSQENFCTSATAPVRAAPEQRAYVRGGQHGDSGATATPATLLVPRSPATNEPKGQGDDNPIEGLVVAPVRLGVLAMVLGSGVLTAAPTAASYCPDPGSHSPWSNASDGDAGGVSGGTSSPADDTQPVQHSVAFRALDERLRLFDNLTDGRVAEACGMANSPKGAYVERDILRTGSDRTFELGTPDGSGDIPDGHQVSVSLRPEGCEWPENVWLTA